MSTNKQQVVLHVFTTLSELNGGNSSNINLFDILGKSHQKEPVPDEEKNDKEEENKEMEEDILFTIKQFAKYFLISENSARDWVNKGYVKHIRIGKRIRIRKSEILALEKRKRAK